jgi:hypothetical protein
MVTQLTKKFHVVELEGKLSSENPAVGSCRDLGLFTSKQHNTRTIRVNVSSSVHICHN